VLFRVSSAVPSFSDGVLLRSGARIAPENYKESPEDFVLWKPAKADEPFWESPWGNGRMGWHAECSSLVHDNLEGVIDIHGGGADLLFPHHECEIMQSENAYGHRLTNYWLHNGMLTVDGQKMAKSVGNVVLVSSALRTAHGEALRYLLMTAHYRQPLDFTRERLDEAQANMDRLYGALEAVWDGDIVVGEFVPTDVLKALENDLNTPEALAALHALADRAYKASEPAERLEIREQILAAGKLLGLFQMSPEKWFRGMIAPEDRPEIERWIEHREQARRNKNFKLSDAVRDRLRTLFWIEIEDTPQGPKWRRVRNWIANIYEE
jgi:cysteinyl-tRNA synthetase